MKISNQSWVVKSIISIIIVSFSLSAQAIDIYGHRGARGLSPENTIPAYSTGLKLGIDVVDMDINMTKDGVLVVTHDFTLNPDITRDKDGSYITSKDIYIKNLNLQQLKQYDVGKIKPGSDYSKWFPYQWPVDHTAIPTLKEVIQYVKTHAPSNIRYQIEIKTEPDQPNWTFSPEVLAKALAKVMVEENIVDKTEVQAFDFRCLIDLQKILPTVQTAYLTDADISHDMHFNKDPKVAGLWSAGYLLKDYNDSIPQMIASLGGKIWGPQYTEVTPELVKQAHKLGLKVVPWGWTEVSGKEIDPPIIEKLIDANVDGIITDRPDIVAGLFAARNIKRGPYLTNYNRSPGTL